MIMTQVVVFMYAQVKSPDLVAPMTEEPFQEHGPYLRPFQIALSSFNLP